MGAPRTDFDKETELEKQLLARLDNDTIWKDAGQAKALGQDLEAARSLRSSRLAPVLAKHIGYSPYKLVDQPLPKSTEYPCFDILKRTGTPAVGAILNELKTLKLDDKADKFRQKLLVSCLLEIYSEGGFGPELTRQRIELEASKSTEKERKLLQEALSRLK
jgi:hypothetical protein